MRVCLVSSYYPPYTGGAETYVGNLARNLAELGHDVTVYCGGRPLGPGEAREGGVTVVRMRMPLSLYGTPLAWFPPSLAAERFDVIHCNFPNPYFAAVSGAVARAKGVPAVLTWHNDLLPTKWPAALLIRVSMASSAAYLEPYSRIIATTGIYARTSRVLLRHSRKVEVIHNGVDAERFAPSVDPGPVKEKHRLDGHKTLIFVGTLTSWHTFKGVEDLLHAFAIARKTCEGLKLLVVGGGNMLGRYRGLARGLGCGGDVVFTGRVSEDDLPAYYSASDFAVLPSRDASEGFGLTLLEAMATGKAVIGSRVGGVPEVIEDGRNGVLVPPRDPEGLAGAIRALYADDEGRQRMGAAGRRSAETMSWKTVARRVESLYEEVAR